MSFSRLYIVGSLAIFGLWLLFIYGMMAHFMPSISFWRIMILPSFVAIIVVTKATFVCFHDMAQTLPQGHRWTGILQHPVRNGIGLFLINFLIVYNALHIGLPALASHFVEGQETTHRFIVQNSVEICDGGIRVKHPYYGHTEICGRYANRPLQNIRKGRVIEVKGRESFLGFRYGSERWLLPRTGDSQ